MLRILDNCHRIENKRILNKDRVFHQILTCSIKLEKKMRLLVSQEQEWNCLMKEWKDYEQNICTCGPRYLALDLAQAKGYQ